MQGTIKFEFTVNFHLGTTEATLKLNSIHLNFANT